MTPFPSNGFGYAYPHQRAIRAFLFLREAGALTANAVAIDTGRVHGPSLSAVDCGCGWGSLCDTGPFGALCGARTHHGRRGFGSC